MFNFHSIPSVIIAKLRTKSSQRAEICKYKTDTGSDGNLMPIKMFRMVFPYTNITDLNKSMDKNSIIHLSNSYIPQMGVCKITIINKGIECIYSFFVMLDNEPALLEMADCEGSNC